MKRNIILFILLAILPITTLSSQSLKDTVFLSYRFGVDSLEKTCIIDVPSGCEKLNLRIRGGLDKGKCKVIFKNVEGLWQNNLQLGYYDRNSSVKIGYKGGEFGSMSKDKLHARNQEIFTTEFDKMENSNNDINGTIIHTELRPQEGKWKVVMIPENAEAEIEVEYSIQ